MNVRPGADPIVGLLYKARLRFEAKRQNGRHEAASHGSALFGFGVSVAPLSFMGAVLKR